MNKQYGNSRRNFLKTAALAAPAALGAGELRPGAKAADAARQHTVAGENKVVPSWNYLGKSTRLSICMWDFSWLESSYPGGPFENLEQRVAEAAERGYNTLRVDCFPSRLLESRSDFHKNWVPGTDLPIWGMIATSFSCNVRERLSSLATLCRKHGLWLGLDSWDVNHMFTAADPEVWDPNNQIAEVNEERAFTRYGELWSRALKLIREDGVLDQAVWVAPMNEVPHFGHLASVKSLGEKLKSGSVTNAEAAAELDAIYHRVNVYMGTPIKAELARDGIPLSYSSITAENYAARVSDIYDVIDLHFMPGVIESGPDKVAFQKVGPNAPKGRFPDFRNYDLKAFSKAWDNACHDHYPAMLERVSSFFKTALEHMMLPSGKRLQAIITEAYGPLVWPDNPAVDWEWYKRYNSDALRIVAEMDFTGATLSNYAHPLFTLWNDIDWHWVSNNYFRTAPALTVSST